MSCSWCSRVSVFFFWPIIQGVIFIKLRILAAYLYFILSNETNSCRVELDLFEIYRHCHFGVLWMSTTPASLPFLSERKHQSQSHLLSLEDWGEQVRYRGVCNPAVPSSNQILSVRQGLMLRGVDGSGSSPANELDWRLVWWLVVGWIGRVQRNVSGELGVAGRRTTDWTSYQSSHMSCRNRMSMCKNFWV